MKPYEHLAIDKADDLIFGRCPKPVTTPSGLTIGAGEVWPEVNFTLPTMTVSQATFPKVLAQYRQMIQGVLERAKELQVPGLVVEFETVPDMTAQPGWGLEITRLLLDALAETRERHALPCALRLTPNDNREMVRPPQMRSGEHWESMLELFETGAQAGADMLSIESVGGKEVHDDALMYGDLPQALFGLCVMGVRDMEFLWGHIVEIAERHGVIPAGDTACGFANTAMVLAEKGMIPKVFAAVDRAMSAVRSLVAYEQYAVGPGKDCGYENPILKAITGCPMSMEGKSASCAHLSPLGNLPLAYGDLWSNESVQNLKLLGGMAPTVSTEQLIYDVRLLSRARTDGEDKARLLRDWLVESDAHLDPQAFIFRPENILALARTIVDAKGYYQAGRNVALKTVELLKAGLQEQTLTVDSREVPYLESMQRTLEELPEQEEPFVERMMAQAETHKFIAGDYQLSCC